MLNRELVLIRHAQTLGNLEHRYTGSTDEPLCAVGLQTAQEASHVWGDCIQPECVHTSTLIRAVSTAQLLFPHARIEQHAGLREMGFGIFEGRSAEEMRDDARYRAWVDSLCAGPCPGGESKEGFCTRTVQAFIELAAAVPHGDAGQLVCVVHGGTIMALMEALCEEERPYFDWHVGFCEGYRAELASVPELRYPVIRNARLVEL